MTCEHETFPSLLERLHAERYTGAIVIQFGQGVPSVIEIPAPSRVIRLRKEPKQWQRASVAAEQKHESINVARRAGLSGAITAETAPSSPTQR